MSADKQTRSKNRKSPSDLQRLSRRFMSGLLRSLFFIHKPARFRQAGFVLPTTVLLLLVLTLTVGALSFRAFSRSGNVIALREQQVIDSAAAPAIDRAKAKLEYLFSKDSRFPGGIPSSDVVASMMLNDNTNGIPKITANDPYTFPKETRLDINGDSKADNAWVFPSDVDGNGTIEADELVTYSILMDDEATPPGSAIVSTLSKELSPDKAKALVTRNGPINTSESVSGCGSARAPEAGWQVVNTATLQKNFQVTAFVANRNNVNRTVSAIELQQVRQADRGNKWGAWFKYDLELFPGATRDFFWNGAMHTEGNLLVRDKYKARMISSHNSCLYNEPASEITLASIPASPPKNQPAFLGQLLSAQTDENNFSGSSSDNNSPGFHQFTSNTQAPTQDVNAARLGTDNDSVTASREHLRNILIDPIKLFTADVSMNRSTAGWSRDASWNNRRITNKPSQVPYLDDTYRADNRYGPKPVYDKNNQIPTGTSVGTPITSNAKLTNLDAANNLYGLDGYWERRAIGQGLRIIVGQRLELGNKFGWKGVAETNPDLRDPLYPTRINTSTETRQKRSLYDNLAAVQGMVVYHYKESGGTLPLACIASTAHPGTSTTLINSRTFNTVNINGTAKLNTDFFNGVGTNGWEFAFPYTTASSFATAIGATEPLGKVLRNLSYFAGDPLGGAPSFEPVQDGAVHPSPYMAAWGDFSNLRRILASGTAYANLSPADQSTLHSAACTAGMLTYNLNNEIQLSTLADSSLQSLGTQLEQLIDGGTSGGGAADVDTYIGRVLGSSPGNNNHIPSSLLGQPIITSGARSQSAWVDTVNNSVTGSNPRTGCLIDVTGSNAYDRACDAADFYAQFSSEDFFRVLLEQNALGATLDGRRAQAIALTRGSQFNRDRLLGFRRGGMPAPTTTGANVVWNSDTGLIQQTVGSGSQSAQIISGCDPDVFGSASNTTNGRIGLAMAFCQDISKDVKYPSLYYLFPFFTHDHDGSNQSSTTGIFLDHSQPATEEYIADSYVTGKNTNGSENNYYAVSNADIAALGAAFTPRATDFADWKLPPTAPSSGTGTVLTDPDTQPFRITIGTSGRDVALLDKGMYDGRELMSLRMLDLDIKKLADGTIAGDRWISNVDGIVYAFREDAIREDAIVRPKASGTNWSDCNEWSKVYSNSTNGSSGFPVTGNPTSNGNCRLKKLSSAPFLQDPPLMTDTRISTKPIDFYADPDRRPYGFRLVNGATLDRANNVQSGMTFVTDNTVYVKGNFNLHSSSGGLGATSATACSNLIEEFTARLIADDCTLVASTTTDFYDGRASTQRNNDFALPETDKWRPVEIVGDAVGVLSPSFKDGNIEHGFTLARQEGEWGYASSSYQNQNRLKDNSSVSTNSWKHVGDNTTPIFVDRNGGVTKDGSLVDAASFIRLTDTLANPDKFSNKRGGDLQPATRTIVNAVFISGIIPSQAGQTYGGMHNFPRFLEHWRSVDLHISGGFFQLNFSTSATAPFDQDAWEPGDNARVNDERVRFYGAPNRLWGYDVGLQYAPAGPIARRFVTVGRPRSEFYRELPVNDPYVTNLRCAKYANNSRVYPAESSCPT